jgi:hypothetical protein
VLADDLKVMDASAVALCRDNNIPIVVFNIRQPATLPRCWPGGNRDDRAERGVEMPPTTRQDISAAACMARSKR